MADRGALPERAAGQVAAGLDEGSAPVRPIEITVITGLSGAGRSTAAKCFEDLGWFVVDNLPPELIPTLVELGARASGPALRLAVVVDVRGGAFFPDLHRALDRLADQGLAVRILFLESADEVLVRRFEHVRRPHPLQGDDRLVDGIAAERLLLSELRDLADLVVDTTALNVHELRATLDAAFGAPGPATMRATVVSFGYKHGLPLDADLVVDCRFLPNPHWVPGLQPLTGRDPAVRDYVLAQDGAVEFLDRVEGLARLVAAGYAREDKRFLNLAVGCTGGRHRSVAITEQLAARLASVADVRVVHRDVGRA